MKSIPSAASLLALFVAPASAQLPLGQWSGQPPEISGWCVRSAGDVDGDGVEDVLFGSLRNSQSMTPSWAQVRVHSGTTGAELLAIRDLPLGLGFGSPLDALDDVDGDGRDDFAVGTPGADFGAGVVGAVSACSGLDGSILWQRAGTAVGETFGYVVERTGDLDGDGIRDLAVCTTDTSSSPSGSVTALSGATGAILWSVAGSAPGDGFGWTVASLGDVDLDGIDDVAVGAATPIFPYPGAVHVLSGANGSRIRTIAGGFMEGIGWGVGGVGDVDGDGRADVASYGSTVPAGIRLYSGRTGALIRVLGTTGFGGLFDRAGDVDGDGTPDLLVATARGAEVLSGADGSRLRLYALHGPRSRTHSVALGGDLDGDGRRDFLLGGVEIDPLTGISPGGGEAVAYSAADSSDVVSTCSGDGSSGPCPCFNPGDPGAGCGSGSGGWAPVKGALLVASGSRSVQADDLRFALHTERESAAALLFAGDASLPAAPFGAGLLCAGGTLVRLELAHDVPRHAAFGPGLGALGGWSAGERRTFQVWFREPSRVCGSEFNLSNAVEVLFAP